MFCQNNFVFQYQLNKSKNILGSNIASNMAANMATKLQILRKSPQGYLIIIRE